MARRRLGFWLRLCVLALKPPLTVFTNRTWLGNDNVPASGPVILAVNHHSHADPFTIAHWVYDLPRAPRFLAKESLFRVPFVKQVLYGANQIPVYRGSKDASAALRDARAVLDGGGAVIIYPEGTVTKDPGLWPMQAKTGVARLALETGAPVVPVAEWGSERIFDPRTNSLRLRLRTKITVVAGPPVDLSAYAGVPMTTEVLRAATDTIMRAIRDLLADIRHEQPPTDFCPRPAVPRDQATSP